MRFKLVPEPPATVEFVADARRAVPLVPGTEDDCCARLMRRLDFPSRDVARTWLTFLRALGLVEETESGFRRTDVDPTVERLRAALLDRVYGAEETLTTLRTADVPLDADAAFAAFRERVPVWERHKDPGRWEETWRRRVSYLLDWLALLGLAERTDAGYRPTDATVDTTADGSV